MSTRDDLQQLQRTLAASAFLQAAAERSGMGVPPLFAPKPETLAMAADVLGELLATGEVQTLKRPGKGRPADTDAVAGYKRFAAWVALHCDAELMALPRAENGDPDEAAKTLGICGSGSRLKQLAKEYKPQDEPLGNAEHLAHCIEYLKQRKKINETTERARAIECVQALAFWQAASR